MQFWVIQVTSTPRILKFLFRCDHLPCPRQRGFSIAVPVACWSCQPIEMNPHHPHHHCHRSTGSLEAFPDCNEPRGKLKVLDLWWVPKIIFRRISGVPIWGSMVSSCFWVWLNLQYTAVDFSNYWAELILRTVWDKRKFSCGILQRCMQKAPRVQRPASSMKVIYILEYWTNPWTHHCVLGGIRSMSRVRPMTGHQHSMFICVRVIQG